MSNEQPEYVNYVAALRSKVVAVALCEAIEIMLDRMPPPTGLFDLLAPVWTETIAMLRQELAFLKSLLKP